MSDVVLIRRAQLEELIRQAPAVATRTDRNDWFEMLSSLTEGSVRCHLMEKDGLLTVYRQRLESASARGDELGGLRAAVDLLAASTRTRIGFVLIPWRGEGFFVWLSEDLSEVISVWRSPDQRDQ